MKFQYPYKLQTLAITTGDITDDNNDFVETPEVWVDVSVCRDEEGRRFKVVTGDGTDYISTVVILAPKGTEAIAPGCTVRVMDGETVRAQKKVMASRAEQFHTRIWV